MGNGKKKEILQLIATLSNTIRSMIGISEVETVTEILIRCQKLAVYLGNALEKRYQDTVYREQSENLVRILEAYSENLYKLSVNLSDEQLCEQLVKESQDQLLQLEFGVREKLPDDRKEIVFLPYKASMWDSLESVWKAAGEDENCDAYVIPIPYYDRNPDGSFREMHYEGDQYPANVPIIDYRSYDFEKRKPDVIFIHNPYDDCNYVTSVHPFFYSKNLKQFTGNLVYIPYFILDEIQIDDCESVKAVEHFCTVPGVINADKIIVQSENIRQIYINVLTRETGGTEQVKIYWENKILGLGSPKIDKVLTTKKEALTIPEKWLNLIQRPDGSWKKIIFYNTGVDALYRDCERHLIKIQNTLECFEDIQDDIVLLWRPHPLTESTLISLHLKWWEKYKAIRDKYINKGWGIYDDTSDMNRAIALSDAYYGDWSSIVYLYQKTGKMVMIQNPDIIL